MSRRNTRVASGEGYVSYGDALSWMVDFSHVYRCLIDWKLTVRRENDGSVGTYLTAFVKPKGGGSKLLGHQVVRFGRDQESVTVPAAMIKALILLDRELGGSMDGDSDENVSSDPASPL